MLLFWSTKLLNWKSVCLLGCFCRKKNVWLMTFGIFNHRKKVESGGKIVSESGTFQFTLINGILHYRIFKINNLFIHEIFHWRHLLIGRCRAQRHSSMLPWSSSKFSKLTWKEVVGARYGQIICCTRPHKLKTPLFIVFTHFSVNSIWEREFASVADHKAYKFDYIHVLTICQCQAGEDQVNSDEGWKLFILSYFTSRKDRKWKN